MISYGCPVCHGALFIETFRADQHWYAELICINGGHLWKAEHLRSLVSAHDACCSLQTRSRIEQQGLRYIQQEAPWLFTSKADEGLTA